VLARAIWSLLGKNIGKVEKSVKSSTTIVGSGAGAKNDESAAEPEEIMMIEDTWMQPYLAYMINKKLPEDAVEAKRITQ
jgi:hypothetical protein